MRNSVDNISLVDLEILYRQPGNIKSNVFYNFNNNIPFEIGL